MNIVEPIADAVTGGLAASATEPRTGIDASGHTTEGACLNCRTPLVGTYCHACGQKGQVHRTLHAFAHDLLHGVLHFEGKIFRTLPKLMVKPGELTRRYIAGERARFVSPLALFLFSVFTMFAVVSLLGTPSDLANGVQSAEASAAFAEEQSKVEKRLQQLREQRSGLVARNASTAAIDEEIRSEQMALNVLTGLGGRASSSTAASQTDQRDAKDAAGGKASATVRAPIVVRQQSDTPTRRVEVGETAVLGFQPDSAFDQAYKAAKSNPSLLIYKLQTNAYKFSWALILISTPFMALLFLWRWRPLYDHAVFVTYSITAVSIFVILCTLLMLAGVSAGPLFLAATIFLPWHMYRQLRGGYGLRRRSALWRTAALLFFAAVALGLFAFGLLMVGVLG